MVLLAVCAAQAQPRASEPKSGGAVAKPRVWLGPEGNPLPFSSEEDVLEFLKTAKVIKTQNVPVGITAPQKLLLEKDGVRANAHFTYIDEEKAMAVLRDGRREMGFRDSYRFQGAAYALARLLGLDNVPPVVQRSIGGRSGALSLWIEHTMTEKDRLKKAVEPARPQEWVLQMKTMHVFDQLIYNTDRNQGNILIDDNWKLWMIDHTRAFRRNEDLLKPEELTLCGRRLWQRLQEVPDAEIEARLKPHLTGMEIRALLKRRTKIVSLFRQAIQQRGEAAILFKED